MDSQGASFAFDASMDFSTAFATQQQHFSKPVEDETSGFFADEGIDTATFIDPTVFNTLQGQTYMPQNLAMGNTSASTSGWDTQATPQLQQPLSTFPPTPVQSFDSIYQQGLSTSLGKRPLEMDQFDFPQAKRHELVPMQDFPLFPSMPSTASATSNWGLDAQLTPPISTTEFGLSDDAADVCATWFHKFNVLPSDRHIESLSQLTGESADAIRSWFGRLLKQGMGSAQNDSAYKSQTSLTQHESLWNGSYSADTLQASPSHLFAPQTESSTTPEATTTTVQPATALRRSKKRCTPTQDPRLLGRDPNKIYQCTRKCGKRYGRKCDWKRNEEEGYPCKSWVCSLCTSEGVENVKPCFRKYHFVQHFRNIHPDVNADDHEETSIVSSETEFPRHCGFCPHRFVSRQDRIDHIADHFKAGKSMLDWRDEDDHDNHDSDNNDDDDDNGSNGDGFDGAPSFPPPPFDPSGEPGSKHFGGNGSSGAGSQDPRSQSGYFQFQLSQLDASQDGAESPIIDPLTQEKSVVPVDQTQLEDKHSSLDGVARDCSIHGKQSSTPESGQDAMARNVLSQPLTNQPKLEQALATEPANGPTEHRLKDNSQVDEDLLEPYRKLTSSDGDAISPIEATVLAPSNIYDRVQKAGHDLACSSYASRSSSSSPPMSPALSSQKPQCVPPASKSFLSVRLLGAGGFSTVDEVVHRGTHLRLGRKTLKNRDEGAVEELRKEISVLQKLRHPHVIRFLDAYSSGDKMSILLSPVAETTLALWLDRTLVEKPENLKETIVNMFGCLVSSVRYLHEQRPVVVHMDIKPQNILIVNSHSELPQVVLCDFGISSSEDLRDEHVVAMTRRYTAPEAFEGFARKQAADIFSLGCVFIEMASVSFSGDNPEWLEFRKDFSGRTGKYYWQEVPDVQARLTSFVEGATSATEETVADTLKTMLSPEPSERPDAASLTMIFAPAPCCLDWPNDKAVYPGPQEEVDLVKVLGQEEHVGCHGKTYTCDAIQEVSSNKMFAAEDWLHECTHSHEACRYMSSSETTALPTRLVEILSDDPNDLHIRLADMTYIERSDHQIDYMALSHVWNPSQPVLVMDALDEWQKELPLDRLAEDVKVAIATTRRLGYRYMWADSLCVIQDSIFDKQQECTNMASVFRNAALTLVLDQLAPPDTLEPHSTNAPSTCSPTHTKRIHPSKPHPAPSLALPAIAFHTPGFAWDTRAWVLQERLLSRRFLHLGKQLYWECNSLKASETFPRGLAPLVWEKVHSQRNDCIAIPLPRVELRADTASDKPTALYIHRLPSPISASRRRGQHTQQIRTQDDTAADIVEDAQRLRRYQARYRRSVQSTWRGLPTPCSHADTIVEACKHALACRPHDPQAALPGTQCTAVNHNPQHLVTQQLVPLQDPPETRAPCAKVGISSLLDGPHGEQMHEKEQVHAEHVRGVCVRDDEGSCIKARTQDGVGMQM